MVRTHALLHDNKYIDVSKIKEIEISHTLKDEMIILLLKDYSTSVLLYKDSFTKNDDFKEIENVYNEFNYIEEEAQKKQKETLF